MWEVLLAPRLSLLNGNRRDLRAFGQELAHHVVHRSDRDVVLWCDGDHGFNPYDFAERNLTRGHQPDHGAKRVLIKRCMTAFQWDMALTQHLDEKLEAEPDVALILAAPYDALLTHQELQDWEQEDHTRISLAHLHGLARRFDVPIVLAADMTRWWQSHPVLAQMAFEAVDDRWFVEFPNGRPRAVNEQDGRVIDPWLRREVTLLDFAEEEGPMVVPVASKPKRASNGLIYHANRR